MSKTKHIKDYISFYIGQTLSLHEGLGINLGLYFPDVWTKGGDVEPNGINALFLEGEAKGKGYTMNFNQCKLVLRPLWDMKKEEALEIIQIENSAFIVKEIKFFPMEEGENQFTWSEELEPPHSAESWSIMDAMPEQFHYLLSRGFDLFGLIEAGIALDKTKML